MYNFTVIDMPDTSSSLFNVLGDPTRRQLFEALARDGEQNVRALTQPIHRLRRLRL